MTIPLPEQLPYSRATDPVVNLTGSNPFLAQRHQPGDRQALIDVITEATLHQREVRAIGSAWSFSDVIKADTIIDTMFLRYHLSQPYGAGNALDSGRLRPGNMDTLAAFCARHGSESEGRAFVHVEAGIKIWRLLADLKSCGLALPTMGAGGGQSLAGALSTGTHGADFRTPPLVEWIRAIHLVGPMGREWWLTPSHSFFADVEVLKTSDWPETGVPVANDDVFNAARIAMGRFGVIYSFVLEVVQPYSLLETTQRGSEPGIFRAPSPVISIPRTGTGEQIFTNPPQHKNTWKTVREALQLSDVVAGTPSGAFFDTPITDFDNGWLREEVVGPTISAIEEAFYKQIPHGLYDRPVSGVDPKALSLAQEFYGRINGREQGLLGGAHTDNGESESRFEEFGILEFALEKMGLSRVAASLKGGPVRPLRHLNIVLGLTDPDICWITRRWLIPDAAGTANLEKPRPDQIADTLRADINHQLWGEPRDPVPVMELVGSQIIASVAEGVDREATQWFILKPIIGYIGHSEFTIPLTEFIARMIDSITEELRLVNGWSAEALFLLLYRLVTRSDPTIREKIKSPLLLQIAQIVGSNAFINPARAGESCDMLDVHGYYLDYNTPGDSAEYFFDASAQGYLDFTDEVLTLAKRHNAFGYMGVRFTPKASALLAMQRYDLTASVEVATSRAQTDPVYSDFWAAIHEAATRYLGIPHWGQEFDQSASSIETNFGNDLATWRRALVTLSVDDTRIFSTQLTRDLGLEPEGAEGFFVYDALTAFLAALEGGGESYQGDR